MTPDRTAEFSPADAIRVPASGGRRPLPKRILAVAASVTAAALGVAPHVLHHAGPLAGAALLGGAAGPVLFGVLGLLAAIPLLMRLRSRTGSWRLPGMLLALFALMFVVSTLVIGPAVSGGEPDSRPAPPGEAPAPQQQRHHP